jgi:oligosaccharyl transferase (archaeosortase A-associated)
MKRQNAELIICVTILLLIFVASLVLRIAVPWDTVFGGNTIKLTDNDAYFFVRLMDNLCAHFPALSKIDPYFIYPGPADFAGQHIFFTYYKDLTGQPLFFAYLMGFFAWLLGGGAPSQQTIDLVAVYFPAILGALLVFPVFLIARILCNKWAGLAAALLITLMPGEFLVRTLLGNTDSHVAEIFLTTLFMLFMLMGVNKARELKFAPLNAIDRRGLTLLLACTILAGLCLGMFIALWTGALLFIVISFAWLVLQFISDYLRKQDTLYLGVSGCAVYIVALLITFFTGAGLFTGVALLICIILCSMLALLSGTLHRSNFKPAYIIYAFAGLVVTAIAGAFIFQSQIAVFFQSISTTLTGKGIAETQPMLVQDGEFTLALLWGNYTIASVLALAGLVFIIYRAIKEGQPGMLMLCAWSIIIIIATLAMRRFAYYMAVNVAILSGLSCWLILRSFGFPETGRNDQAPAPARKESKKARSRRKNPVPSKAGSAGLMAVGAIAVLALTIYPNTGPLPGGDRPFFDVATKALFAPPDGWCDALKWLREKSPEPFGDARYYYEQYRGVPRRADYSVLTWWDYGYWITRIGHRVPVSNPGDQLKGEQNYFTTQQPAQAAETSASWKMRYVLVDDYMVNWQKGFKAITYAAGKQYADYYEIYYRQQNEGMVQALLYYPEYYKTMAVRLYCFDGKQYNPQETAVISWELQSGPDGRPVKLITGLKTFRNYNDARDFITSQKSGNWRIVGKDPLLSPVPLEALQGYQPAFSSSQKTKAGNTDVPVVKVFEYNSTAGQHE